jgi:hypothetical protein
MTGDSEQRTMTAQGVFGQGLVRPTLSLAGPGGCLGFFALPRVVGCQPTAAQLHRPFISLFCPLTSHASLFSTPSLPLPRELPPGTQVHLFIPSPPSPSLVENERSAHLYRPFDRPAPSPSIPSRLQFFNQFTNFEFSLSRCSFGTFEVFVPGGTLVESLERPTTFHSLPCIWPPSRPPFFDSSARILHSLQSGVSHH